MDKNEQRLQQAIRRLEKSERTVEQQAARADNLQTRCDGLRERNEFLERRVAQLEEQLGELKWRMDGPDEFAAQPRCGGCNNQGSHRRNCPKHPEYSPWKVLAQQVYSIAGSVGANNPQLSNTLYMAAVQLYGMGEEDAAQKLDLWNTPTTSSGVFNKARREGDKFRGVDTDDDTL